MMRNFLILVATFSVAACSYSDDFSDGGGTSDCSIDGQKQFIVDAMNAWYFWNDRLPSNVNIGDYATPQDLLAFLTTFSPDDGTGQPVDEFSFIRSVVADQQILGEGRYEGYGFSWRTVAENDIRLTRVYSDSPAAGAGLARGQRIIALNGRTIAEIQAAEGLNAVFATTPIDFTMRETDGVTEFTVTIAAGTVTIDPLPQWFRVPRPAGPDVGYIELASFISTADPAFDAVFADFRANGVNDVIIDLRYNGGGLVTTTELLGDYFGGDVAENLIFSETRFNADRAAANNRIEFFERLGNSMSLSRLIVIATRRTASASEMIANGMAPHVEVTIVGDNTFGKPVGQVGLEFCGQVLRATAFQLFNADGFGDYFDGLPVDCPAADDLNVAVGAPDDPNMVAALNWLDTGACPAAPVVGGQSKPVLPTDVRPADLRGPAWPEFPGTN